MADKSNEQRDAPPSLRKLRNLRKKGEVATSKDMVGAVNLAAAVGYLLLAFGGITGAGLSLLTKAGTSASLDLHAAEGEIGKAILNFIVLSALPIVALVAVATIVANLAVLRGVPFALDPIKPNFGKLNPIEGLKRLFGLKAWVELGKSLVRITALGAVLIVILRLWTPGLASLPSCGFECVGGQFAMMVRPLLAIAVAMFLVFGLLDVGLQSWLFKRDQKMGKSELKRERKESEGDPLIRSAQRRLRLEAQNEIPNRETVKQPSIVVFDGNQAAVGLRFVRGETPVPVLVGRATGKDLNAMFDAAARQNVSVATDATLVGMLGGIALGDYVPEATYKKIANALRSAGII